MKFLFISKKDGLLFFIVNFSLDTNNDILAGLISVSKIFPTTVLTLFCLMCLIISNQLELIRDQIEQLSINNSFDMSVATRLALLQRRHILISKSIDAVKVAFGPVMLFEILFIFIGVINTVMVNVQPLKNLVIVAYSVVTLGNYTSNFILICLSAEKIKTQVQYI
jgi:hypothetical protein